MHRKWPFGKMVSYVAVKVAQESIIIQMRLWSAAHSHRTSILSAALGHTLETETEATEHDI